jgi:pilus assembly protein CpaF
MYCMNPDMHQHLTLMLRDPLNPLVVLLDDPMVREVMINGADDVWVERAGCLHKTEHAFSSHEARNAIHILGAMAQGDVGRHNGPSLLDAAFSGMRVSAVLSPIAMRGHALCIRKLAGATRSLADYLPSSAPVATIQEAEKVLTEGFRVASEPLGQLTDWVKHRKNILVSGGTSTGKTTFLNALIKVMSCSDRIIAIEDPRELTIELPNYVTFEANQTLGVSVRDLVRQSLRFRPDRIVVGEVRGGEAFDLIQAMNTGHDGCLGTLHANSAQDALHRLEQLVMQSGVGLALEAIARHISNCIDGVVHLTRRNGVRQIEKLISVEGYCNGHYQTHILFSH